MKIFRWNEFFLRNEGFCKDVKIEHQKMHFSAIFVPKNAIYSHFFLFLHFYEFWPFFIRMMHRKGVLFVRFRTVRVSNFIAYFCTARVRFWKSFFGPNVWSISERVPPPPGKYILIESRFSSEHFQSVINNRIELLLKEMFFKNSIKTSFYQNSHFQNFKISGMDFELSEILKSFINSNNLYISLVDRTTRICQWFFTLASLDYTVWFSVDLHFRRHKPIFFRFLHSSRIGSKTLFFLPNFNNKKII